MLRILNNSLSLSLAVLASDRDFPSHSRMLGSLSTICGDFADSTRRRPGNFQKESGFQRLDRVSKKMDSVFARFCRRRRAGTPVGHAPAMSRAIQLRASQGNAATTGHHPRTNDNKAILTRSGQRNRNRGLQYDRIPAFRRVQKRRVDPAKPAAAIERPSRLARCPTP